MLKVKPFQTHSWFKRAFWLQQLPLNLKLPVILKPWITGNFVLMLSCYPQPKALFLIIHQFQIERLRQFGPHIG